MNPCPLERSEKVGVRWVAIAGDMRTPESAVWVADCPGLNESICEKKKDFFILKLIFYSRSHVPGPTGKEGGPPP